MEVTNVPDCDDNDYSLLLFHPNTLFCGILEFSFLLSSIIFILPFSNPFHAVREIHPLDSQPHRHCTLAPRACAPRVTRCSLGKYWSRDFSSERCWSDDLCSKHAAESQQPVVHRLSMTHSGSWK